MSPAMTLHPVALTRSRARQIWLRAQRLDIPGPFGEGPGATVAAVEHLGYVQIDTINVIERCHHHILYTRIPEYRRADLHRAQSVDKAVFECWTHALSYAPTRDLSFHVGAMRRELREHGTWFTGVKDADVRRVIALLRREGPLSIRDITDDVLIEKDHAWASRKPSKRALALAFFQGRVAISQRNGILKTYELMNRHFGWARPPAMAAEPEVVRYRLERALRTQGIVSLDSACYLDPRRKKPMRRLIDARVRRGELVRVRVEGAEKLEHWAAPETLEIPADRSGDRVHILSPFDPLVNQRKRVALLFGYEHRFEAYLPPAQRIFGYFALPVLVGDEIVAAIDLKTDRAAGRLLVRQWTWVSNRSRRERRRRIEEELHRFERFQLAR
jgi:uncharacterized protein